MVLKKKDNNKDSCCPSENKEKYPYGLRINLQREQLEVLGIQDLPKTGTSFNVLAKGKVIGSHINEGEGDEANYKSLDIQIVELQLKSPEGEKEPLEERIYKG